MGAITMKTLTILLTLAFSLTAHAVETYQMIGNTMFGSDGSYYNQIGNTTYFNDGTTYQQIGNTTFGSNGQTIQRIGNTYFVND